MKDGFDKSVAEKMPKIQKKRPNRPWNVDPVLIKPQEEKIELPLVKGEIQQAPVTGSTIADVIVDAKTEIDQNKFDDKKIASVITDSISTETMEVKQDNLSKTVETIEDLTTDFTKIIFEKKDVQRKLIENQKVVNEMEKENLRLKESLDILTNDFKENKMIEKEIIFLNEQLEDADYYIKNMVGILDERTLALESETAQKKKLEEKYSRINKEIQEKAKLDVKVSILERDLNISQSRIFELESKLDNEFKKREPLEDEIVELKNALDRVYSSLSHIRLKAKREVYGS